MKNGVITYLKKEMDNLNILNDLKMHFHQQDNCIWPSEFIMSKKSSVTFCDTSVTWRDILINTFSMLFQCFWGLKCHLPNPSIMQHFLRFSFECDVLLKRPLLCLSVSSRHSRAKLQLIAIKLNSESNDFFFFPTYYNFLQFRARFFCCADVVKLK